MDTADAALEGARNILIERMAETPTVVRPVREMIWKEGALASRPVKGKEAEGAKFSDYFDFSEPISKMPSHRALALLRVEKEGDSLAPRSCQRLCVSLQAQTEPRTTSTEASVKVRCRRQFLKV